jgi:RHS repeat-associated protein
VTETYTYDGEGRRVSKTNPSGTTVYVYDGQGELAVEYAPTAPASGTQYLIADALGTTRLVTGPTGAQVECHDYLPFGEEIGAIDSRPGCFGGDSVPEAKFTGKERDGRTGLDYFGARYFSGAEGRFTSPDSYNIVLEMLKGRDEADQRQILNSYLSNPQSWNKYAYVLNNPLTMTDPDGRRELTDEDRRRFDKLRAAAAATHDRALINQVDRAIRGLETAIAAVKEGAGDPVNLRAVFFAIDHLGDTNYGRAGLVSVLGGALIGVGSKCNVFCANAYISAGANYPLTNGLPPRANTLATSDRLGNFVATALPKNRLGPSYPGIGDIVAWGTTIPFYFHGHSALSIGSGVVIYAGPGVVPQAETNS